MLDSLLRPLILSLALLLIPMLASPDELRFRQFTGEDGLSNPSVYAIVRDQTGLLWIGTEDGLNRYDGYAFDLFEHDPLDARSIAGNDVSKLLVDLDGRIWVGTWGSGLDRFDPRTGIAEHFLAQPNRPDALNDQRIQALDLDTKGALWIGTYDGGLTRLDAARETFRTWRADGKPGSISNDRVWAIAEAPDGAIWIGTEDGMNRFDPGTETFARFLGFEESSRALSHELIRSITFDSGGRMWVGTEGGLNLVDFATTSVRYYLHDPDRTDSLHIDIINDVFQDSNGTIWVLTNDGGLSRYEPRTDTFETWRHESGVTEGLGHDDVRVMIEDGASILWVGTRGGGLNALDLKPKKFENDIYDPSNPNGLADPEILSILEDPDGTLWVGTTRALHRRLPDKTSFERLKAGNANVPSGAIQHIYRDKSGQLWISIYRTGLCAFDPDSGCRRIFTPTPGEPDSIASDVVSSIFEDREGRFWVGTTKGLDRFDRVSEIFRHYRPSELSQSPRADDYVRTILQDSDGTLWIGTDNGGLARIDPESSSIEIFESNSSGRRRLSSDRVSAIFEDHDQILWIGTDHGLNRFDRSSETLTHFLKKDGLPRANIRGILEDDDGSLWISTTGGLARLDPARETFRNYSVRDGLQDNAFNEGAAHRGPSGRMYFGGARGLTRFMPDMVLDNPHRPPIAIVRFTAGDDEVHAPDLDESLELSWDRNSITLQVAALDFTRPEDNEYAHMLEGFDSSWNQDGTRRFIRYTNLPPGEYTLRVRASNNDGVWNEEGIAISMVVLPPFWMTMWFRALAVLGVILVGFLLHRARVATLQARRKELEETVEERTSALREKKEQVEQINRIVERINAEVDFDKVLEMMLDVSSALHGVDIAMAIVFDPLSERYRIRSATGWDAAELADVALTSEQVEQEYVSGAREPFDNLFVREVKTESSRRITITMRIVIGHDVAGYLVFENPSSKHAVDMRDLELLHELELHIHSAFLKASIMQELERLSQSKNEFVGIAAHDLRTPLGVVVGWVSVVIDQLQAGRGDTSATIEQLRKVHRAAEEMESLVRDLLDISAIEAGNVNLERIRSDFAKFVAVSIEPHKEAADRKGIALSFNANVDPAPASFDPSRIAEVIDNLVSNAIKYTYPGGKIHVTCERVGEEIVTHVTDNGQGLTDDDMRFVFRTFRKLSARPTAGEMSTGLGLAIVKKLVEIHGGRVWVESVKGEGSTFSFALPSA